MEPLLYLARVDPIWVPIVMFICGTVIAIVAILKSKNPAQDSPQSREEARTIQELHSQCNRLANRIEALETIILEHERQKENQ